MNKVVFVKAYFAPVGKVEVFKVPTGEKKKGVFGGDSDVTRDEKRWVQTGLSDSEINTGRLTKDLQETVENLNKDGYEVISVTQVISGAYNWKSQTTPSSSYGYGYSYTDGLIVIARKT